MWSVQPALFGWFHILGIVVAAGFGYAGVVIGRKYKAKDCGGKVKRILWAIEITFIVLEAAKEIYYAIENGGYRWDLFPMQICSIIFIVLPVALLCRDGVVKDSIYGFIGICSLTGALFYLCNPTVALNSPYILLSMHSFVWHFLMIMTGTFVLVSFDILNKNTKRTLVGAYTVWLIFAVIAAVVNNIAHAAAPQLNIDYYHIGYVKVIYPLLNLFFKYPEPYIPFFLIFLVYFGLGTVGVYYAARGISNLNRAFLKKKREGRR